MLGPTGMRGWHARAAGAQLLGPANWPQITALPQINARSSEFEPKYLRTSIALWVDGGSEETQYSVLSTRYSVFSRLVGDRIDYAFFMRPTVTAWIALNRGIQK